jgi:hypothetical protein
MTGILLHALLYIMGRRGGNTSTGQTTLRGQQRIQTWTRLGEGQSAIRLQSVVVLSLWKDLPTRMRYFNKSRADS